MNKMSEDEAIIFLKNIVKQNGDLDAHTTVPFYKKEAKAIETILDLYNTEKEENVLLHSELDKQQLIINNYAKEVDILENHVHYIKCKKCGIEFRAKRSDRCYCENCNKSIQKEWYNNQSDEWKKKRAEKSKLKMREIRAKTKELLEGKDE